MGGVIFISLVALLLVILVLPAIRAEVARRRALRRPASETAHEAVIRRLDDHRTRRKTPTDEGPDA
jgi:hypothetical protein